jgi:hypothetical protein
LRGKDFLQLTKLGRGETFGGPIDVDGRRVYFVASANLPQSSCRTCDNPSENCQLFSIGTRGQGLRQLTHFRHTDRSAFGCSALPGVDGCFILTEGASVNGEIVFYTSCDPFCRHKQGEDACNLGGGNLFAIRTDGSGIRQLTHARGVTELPDGAVHAELPGPGAYAGIGR